MALLNKHLQRGQVETIGLVIVILLLFIGIFALSFSVKDEEVDENILTLKANALRSSLLKTSICNITIKDEIGNCIDNSPECFSDCPQFNLVVEGILKDSLENEGYSFKSGNVKMGNCADKITSVSDVVNGQKIEIAVCRR